MQPLETGGKLTGREAAVLRRVEFHKLVGERRDCPCDLARDNGCDCLGVRVPLEGAELREAIQSHLRYEQSYRKSLKRAWSFHAARPVRRGARSRGAGRPAGRRRRCASSSSAESPPGDPEPAAQPPRGWQHTRGSALEDVA